MEEEKVVIIKCTDGIEVEANSCQLGRKSMILRKILSSNKEGDEWVERVERVELDWGDSSAESVQSFL